jgi:hypothetical protein
MTRTGPQKIPGASQAYFYGSGRYSGSDMEVNCGVVHTTEGRSLPSYNGGALAPTVTGVPDIKAKRIHWYQHYDIDESARALANKSGGVQTNTANAFQMELVGTCDDRYRTSWDGKRAGVDYIHWPTAPDWALAEVAWLVRWLHEQHRVPLTCVRDWLAYGKDSRRPGITPASYGANPARMTHTQWRNFTGWCGHQHVPENDHGDPGSMNFARVLAYATGAPAAPGEDDDMPVSDDDVKRIATAAARAVQTFQNTAIEPHRDVYQVQRDAANFARQAAEQTKGLTELGLTDAQVDRLAAAVAAHPALADAIADKLAARLAN